MGFVGMTIARFTKRKTQVGRFMQKFPPPRDFRKFAYRYDDLKDVWQDCSRPDWMLWMMGCLEFTPADALRRFACYSARRFSSSMKDPRCLQVIEQAEKFARREADWEDVEAARVEAYRALEEARNQNDPMAESLAWAAASVGKDDPFTSANDTLAYTTSLAELQKKDLAVLRELQASKLRDLIGNPFKRVDEKGATPVLSAR